MPTQHWNHPCALTLGTRTLTQKSSHSPGAQALLMPTHPRKYSLGLAVLPCSGLDRQCAPPSWIWTSPPESEFLQYPTSLGNGANTALFPTPIPQVTTSRSLLQWPHSAWPTAASRKVLQSPGPLIHVTPPLLEPELPQPYLLQDSSCSSALLYMP